MTFPSGCEATGKPRLYRIALKVERDDRNRAGCIFRSPDGHPAAREDHVDLSPHEITGETRKLSYFVPANRTSKAIVWPST